MTGIRRARRNVLAAVAAAAAASLIAAPAAGQSFNIDFHDLFGPPPDSYGGVADQTGHWEGLEVGNFPSTNLTDVNETPTLATLSADPLDYLAVGMTGPQFGSPDHPLGADGFKLDDPSMNASMQINNLTNGTYKVVVYTWLDVATGNALDVSVPGAAVEQQVVTRLLNDGSGWLGFIYGYSYVTFIVEITDGTIDLVFMPDGTPSGLRGMQLVLLNKTVATAVPGTTGDWNDTATWTGSDVPETPDEIAVVDGEQATATNVTVDTNIQPDSAWINSGDTVRIDTSGDFNAFEIIINGELILDDQASSSSNAANLWVDVIGGSGSVLAGSNNQNQILSLTPSTAVEIAPTVNVVAPTSTTLRFLSDVRQFAPVTADGGLIEYDNVNVESVGETTATNGGEVDASNSSFFGGLYITEFGSLLDLNTNTFDSAIFQADATSTVDLFRVDLIDSTLDGPGLYLFTDSNSMTGTTTIGPTADVRLPAGSTSSLNASGVMNLEGTIVFEADGGATGKQIAVDGLLELTGPGVVQLNQSSHWIRGLNGSDELIIDTRVEGSGRVGVNSLHFNITAIGELFATNFGERLTLEPKDDIPTVGIVNEGIVGAMDGGIAELRPQTFDNTNGEIVSDNALVELDGVRLLGGVLRGVNGGQFEVSSNSECVGAMTVATSTPVLVLDQQTLGISGDIQNDGDVALQGNAPSGTGSLLFIVDDTSFTGGGSISGDASGNGVINSTGASPVTLTIGVDQTLFGALTLGGNTGLQVDHFGLINANASEPLTIRADFLNHATAGAESGATLEFIGSPFDILQVTQDPDAAIDAGDDSAVVYQFVHLIGGELSGAGTHTVEDSTIEDVDITGNLVISGNSTVPDDMTNNGSFTIPDGSAVTLSAPLYSLNGSGVYTVQPGGAFNGPSSTVNTGPDITMAGGGTWTLAQLNNGGLFNPDGATVNGPVSNDPGATIDIGVIGLFAADGVNNNGGTLGGVGFVSGATNNNSGTFAPGLLVPPQRGGGSTIGAFTVDGAFEQGIDGMLEIELAGDGGVPGADHDQLVVTGNATLSGTVAVKFADGFVPQIGAQYTILTTDGTIIDAFTEAVGPGQFTLTHNADHVVLTVDAIAQCPGDLDGSGAIDVFDLFALLNDWGSCSGCGTDLNDDGVVDVFDLFVLLGAWGPC